MFFAIVLFVGTQAFSQSSSPTDIEHRVESILTQMTLEEKVDLIGGVDGFYIRGVPRLGVPRLKMADGPLGVRNYGTGHYHGGWHCPGCNLEL